MRSASPFGTPLGLLTIARKDERRGYYVTQLLEALLECFVAQNGQHLPLYWRESAKTSKQNLEMLQKDNKVKENFCFYTEIFCRKFQQYISVCMTYSNC
jgi:hypothetical protein